MKNLFLSFVVLAGLTLVSCNKDKENELSTPANTTTTLHVEYRISAESGDVNVTYSAPNANTNELEEKTENYTRTYSTISFDYSSGHKFSVQAVNTNPSHKTVQVELYIDGVLKAKGTSTSPSQIAIASGNF
jgi:hypothetical protein